MIIQCEQCKTRFKLDDSRVKDTGVKVRCSKCKHTFIVKKEVAEEEPDFDIMLQRFGGLPTDEKPDSGAAVSASTKAPLSFQGDEDSGMSEDAGSCSIACTNESRVEIDPGSKVKELESGQGGSEHSDAAGFNFVDFACHEKSSEQEPVPQFPPQDKSDNYRECAAGNEIPEDREELQSETASDVTAEFIHASESQELVDNHSGGSFPSVQSDMESTYFTDMIASHPESCRGVQQDEEVFGSGVKEDKESAALFAESEKAEDLESGFAELGKDSFAAGKTWLDEELPVIAEANDGERCLKVGNESSATLPIGVGDGGKARPFGDFAGEDDDELPPLSIASRRKCASMVPVTIIAVALLIVFALAGTGYFLLNGYSVKSLLQGSGLANLLGSDEKTGGELTVKNFEGSYLVNNEIGEIFVVKGEVLNNSKTPRNALLVKGLVYGPKGKVLVEQTVNCGNVLSNEQLMVFSKVAVEKSLNPSIRGSYGNQVLQPGKGIPFIIVFKNVPQGAEEFGVEVLGAPGASR
jgi:predicted Zn finger-like uncharacterized protein